MFSLRFQPFKPQAHVLYLAAPTAFIHVRRKTFSPACLHSRDEQRHPCRVGCIGCSSLHRLNMFYNVLKRWCQVGRDALRSPGCVGRIDGGNIWSSMSFQSVGENGGPVGLACDAEWRTSTLNFFGEQSEKWSLAL